MSDLERRLRDEAARDPTRFDEARHARLMRGLDRPARIGRSSPARPIGVAMLLAACVAVGVFLWARPQPSPRRLELPGVPSGDVAMLLRGPIDALSPPPVANPAGRVAAFVSDQLGVVASLREARRPT